jgi:hypothetical protein
MPRISFKIVGASGQGINSIGAIIAKGLKRSGYCVFGYREYPNEMPRVYIDAPAITANAPHRYQTGNLCYLHPSMWNPGTHHLTFVIGRAAKWLNKFEVWRNNGGTWPGAEIRH